MMPVIWNAREPVWRHCNVSIQLVSCNKNINAPYFYLEDCNIVIFCRGSNDTMCRYINATLYTLSLNMRKLWICLVMLSVVLSIQRSFILVCDEIGLWLVPATGTETCRMMWGIYHAKYVLEDVDTGLPSFVLLWWYNQFHFVYTTRQRTNRAHTPCGVLYPTF